MAELLRGRSAVLRFGALLVGATVLLCACASAHRLTRSDVQEENGYIAYTDEKTGAVYEKIEHSSYIPNKLGEKYAEYVEDGVKTELYEIDGEDPLLFLASKVKGKRTLYSAINLPTLSQVYHENSAALSFDICYSDEAETKFTVCTDEEIIGAIVDALENGKTVQLPANDCETFYLKFSLGEKYSAFSYMLGCVYDKEENVSYIYDREEKRVTYIGTLLSGSLPYSAPVAEETGE